MSVLVFPIRLEIANQLRVVYECAERVRSIWTKSDTLFVFEMNLQLLHGWIFLCTSQRNATAFEKRRTRYVGQPMEHAYTSIELTYQASR